MRELKFSYMWSDGKSWKDLRYTLDQIGNGEPFEYFDNEPLLRKFKLKAKRQYTGKKDKEGKEVFEGDIIQSENFFLTGKNLVVTYKAPSFYGKLTNASSTCGRDIYGVDLTGQPFEVIGNIYENPELLEINHA